jgi:hypothetical protein
MSLEGTVLDALIRKAGECERNFLELERWRYRAEANGNKLCDLQRENNRLGQQCHSQETTINTLRIEINSMEKVLRAIHDAAMAAAPHIRRNSKERKLLMNAAIEASNHIIPF